MAGGISEVYVTVGYHGEIENLIEKKKSLTYSYKLDATDPVNIENHFGDVKVKFWNKDEVMVNILVTANAPTEKKVDAFLSIVDIKRTREKGEVKFVTNLNCLESSFENNVSKSKSEEDKNFLRVDYQIYMPEGHDLTVNNSHGDVYIPEFKAVLNIKQDYGTLFASHLNNRSSVIDVNFGKAFIKSMTGGRLKANQTSLLIDKVEDVVMTNNCGNVRVLEANNTEIKATYTKGYIGRVNESCKFTVNYSKEFKLGQIMDDVLELEISSSHTNLELPLCMKGKYDLRADTKNTNMVMHEESKVKFMSASNDSEKHYIIGDNTSEHATKVLLSTNYGRVEVK